MDKVKEKVPASGGAETSTQKKIFYNESITPILGNVKRKFESMEELREAM